MTGQKATTVVSAVLVTVLAGSVLVLSVREDAYALRDIDGIVHGSLAEAETDRTILFFLATSCPISQRYAPEIITTCDDYRSEGAGCFLVYPEAGLTAAALREHLEAYGHTAPAILDSDQALVRKAGARITPEAAVYSRSGDLLYRGRIDDWYAGLGRPRNGVRRHDLRDALDALASGETVETPWPDAVGCFIEPLPE